MNNPSNSSTKSILRASVHRPSTIELARRLRRMKRRLLLQRAAKDSDSSSSSLLYSPTDATDVSDDEGNEETTVTQNSGSDTEGEEVEVDEVSV